jgi:pimeloyl-ACP methyl ester carboxylesterase
VTTFALVHGAWHGAWCWERLVAPLRARGHDAVAVDLPCDDPAAGLDAYAAVIVDALDDAGENVVLVTHSLAGLVVPSVAHRRPLRAAVYLAAFIPLAGVSMNEQFAAAGEPILLFKGGRENDDQGRSRWTDVRAAADVLYPDLAPADVQWAFARLRPQAATSQREPSPELPASLSTLSLVCTRDQVMNPDWSRRVTRERLGSDPVEPATGHFPMITAPDLLADALAAAASRDWRGPSASPSR